jgi:peptidoglycan/xylan/chitin deacetylase (PgdA/CDA1 family)
MKLFRVFLLLILFNVFFFPGSPASFAGNFPNGIPVLLYHHVTDEKTHLPKLTVSTEVFDMQLARLKQAGFETITADDLIGYMSGKGAALPAKPVLISFDDGYDDNYFNAFPILKKYGFRATIFMVGVNIDASHRLSAKQIKEMSEYGIDFGAHSVTHRDLTSIAPSELRKETRKSKAAIEKITGKKVKLFSYPYGIYNLPVWEDVEFAGFDGAVTTLSGLTKKDFDNIYLMRRITILKNTDFDNLFGKLDNNHQKKLLLDYWPEFDDELNLMEN